MQVRITADVYSGLPNPELVLEGAEAKRILARLNASTGPAFARSRAREPDWLGYRGLIVQRVDRPAGTPLPTWRLHLGDAISPNRTVHRFGPELEAQLLQREGALGEMASEQYTRAVSQKAPILPRRRAAQPLSTVRQSFARDVAPIYEPGWWNDFGQRQLSNNCYNYSTNYRTDTFAQPGRSMGQPLLQLSCAAVKPLALLDGLEDALSNDMLFPLSGHLVALVVAPGFDFHWYRMGPGGLWSHKVGSGPVTNLDNSGRLILDPRLADRGPYSHFCGFMIVHHGHIKLQ